MARIFKTQYAVCVPDAPVTLKQGQGNSTWFESVGPKQILLSYHLKDLAKLTVSENTWTPPPPSNQEKCWLQRVGLDDIALLNKRSE